MFLYEVIYFSDKSLQFLGDPEAEYAHILQQARSNNEKQGVTGMLFSSGNYFLQVLEGERHVLSRLVLRIGRDNRHANLVIARSRPIAERRFGDWEMAWLNIPSIAESRFRQYLATSAFEPHGFSDEEIDAFVDAALAELASQRTREHLGRG